MVARGNADRGIAPDCRAPAAERQTADPAPRRSGGLRRRLRPHGFAACATVQTAPMQPETPFPQQEIRIAA